MDGQKDLETLQRLRDVAYSKFKRKAKCLQEQIDKEITPETLRRCYDELNKAYEQLEQAHESYLENICISKNTVTELENEESFMDNVDSFKISVTSAYDIALKKSNQNQDTVDDKLKIKAKQIECPKFDEGIRVYPTSKSDCELVKGLQAMQLDFHQAMEEFKTMFPFIDGNVIEAVLRANQGDIHETIDQLLTMKTDTHSQEIILQFIHHMDQVKECCICREVYNEGNHLPIVLPCGHSLCKECVNNVSSELQITEVQCPICRQRHNVNRNQLPTNYVVLDLLRTTGNTDETNESTVPKSVKTKDQDSTSEDSYKFEIKDVEKGSNPSNSDENSNTGWKILKGVAIGVGAVAGGAAAVAAAPVVLTGVGFTSAGITAGSWAASMMSSAAIANGGGVAATSLVALLQSAGAVGLGTGAAAGVGAAGAAVGAAAGTGIASGISKLSESTDDNTNTETN